MIKVKVPATTTNLGPAFDCLGVALDIYNYIQVEMIESGLEIKVPEGQEKYIPKDQHNLVYAAMKKVFDITGYHGGGLRIKLINGIPLTRGLGSSAACIVGGLAAANALSGGQLSIGEIAGIAAEMDGHPDNVMPALIGGMVVSCMDGREVSFVRFTPPSKLKFALMIPDYQLSTLKSREVLPRKVTMEDAVFNISRTALMIASLLTGGIENLKLAVDDRIHQPYRKPLIPHFDEIFERSVVLGAKGVFLSGAGPALVAILDGDYAAFKSEMELFTQRFENHWDIRIVDLCESGVEITKIDD